MIERLRAAGALSLSLVAELDGVAVGHIAFSPMTAQDQSSPWFALGPVSVLPAWQGQGIGSKILKLLIDVGRQEQIQRIIGTILPENSGMQHVSRKLGFEISRSVEERLVIATLDVS